MPANGKYYRPRTYQRIGAEQLRQIRKDDVERIRKEKLRKQIDANRLDILAGCLCNNLMREADPQTARIVDGFNEDMKAALRTRYEAMKEKALRLK